MLMSHLPSRMSSPSMRLLGVILVTGLVACAGKTATIQNGKRLPANEKPVNLLRGCGHAPFRLAMRNGITLRPKFDRADGGTLVTRNPCSAGKCSGFREDAGDGEVLFSLQNGSNFHHRSDIARFEWKSPNPSYVQGQAVRIGSFSTNGYGEQETETLPAVWPEIPVGETSPPVQTYTVPTVEFVHYNRDLTFQDFMEFASPHFDISLDKLDCPLTRAQQEQSCEYGRVPYDPGEEYVEELSKKFFKSEKFKDASIGDRKDAKQNSRGYSYMVHYRDATGEIVAGSEDNRFTPNAYRLFEALTRPLCPGWKITYVALNAHNGKNPYAKWVNENGGREQTHKIESIAYFDRAAEILKNYADGTDVVLNLCFSLNVDDLNHQSRFGNVLMGLDPAKNPVRSVKGFSGSCYTMNARADSPHVPLWIGKLVNNFQKKAEKKAARNRQAKEEHEILKNMTEPERIAYLAGKKKEKEAAEKRKDAEKIAAAMARVQARASPRPSSVAPRTEAERERLERVRKAEIQEESDYAAVGTETWYNPRFK